MPLKLLHLFSIAYLLKWNTLFRKSKYYKKKNKTIYYYNPKVYFSEAFKKQIDGVGVNPEHI